MHLYRVENKLLRYWEVLKKVKLGVALLLAFTGASAADYKAGVARMDITPAQPIRMAGYAAREKLSDGVAMRLSAKALAIEDRKGASLVIVTTDLIGLPRSVSDVVGARVEKEYGLARSRLVLNSSHTHAGPVVWSSERLAPGLSDEQKRVVMEYRNALVEHLVTVIGAALKSLTAVEIQFGTGEARFAVNRRMRVGNEVRIGVNPSGPVDPSVPVLKVSRPDGAVMAVVFGYACHNTTLGSDNLSLSGDYAGEAQAEMEKRIPNATAMFLMLCGGDQNPNPRGKLEQVEQHGETLASEVLWVLGQKMVRVNGPITAAFQVKDLTLAEPLAKPVLYPVQAIRFGKSLTLLALGGEVVVEYALQIKRAFPKERMIVTGYSNDVMAYIPTAAMLKEGGYEPVTSMRYYGLPSPFAADVEERVINGVREVLRRIGLR
jgi:neutral ceramidase